jgi:hypothetical protein
MKGKKMMREQEQSERYQMLSEAMAECARRGVSEQSLETLALESGFSTKHLQQTMSDAKFAELVLINEGRN